MLDEAEFCDDGNNVNEDGCSEECIIEDYFNFKCHVDIEPSVCEQCGNGIISLDEVCDDRDSTDNKGCK